MILYSPEGNPEVFDECANIPDGYCTEEEGKQKFPANYHVHYHSIKNMSAQEALQYAYSLVNEYRYNQEQNSIISIKGYVFHIDRESRNTMYAKLHNMINIGKEDTVYKFGDKTLSVPLDVLKPACTVAEELIDCLFELESDLNQELLELDTASYTHDKLARWLGNNLTKFHYVTQQENYNDDAA